MPIDEDLIYQVGGTSYFSRLDYKCGHCDRLVSGRVVNIYLRQKNKPEDPKLIFIICPSCVKGSVWNEGIIIPGTKPGNKLEGLPGEIEAAYQEARNCYSINAYIGCELLCRKILMHVGVDKGAEEGQSFVSYINYLESKGYITPTIKEWADMIRTIGNQSTHELTPPDKERANATLIFTMELLRIIYEMKHVANKFKKPG